MHTHICKKNKERKRENHRADKAETEGECGMEGLQEREGNRDPSLSRLLEICECF